jgi:hypothetical protein
MDIDGPRPFYGPGVDFPKRSSKLTEAILAVRLSGLGQVAHATLERDEFGFVPYCSAIPGGDMGSWACIQNTKRIERRFGYLMQLLREAFPDLEKDKIKVRFSREISRYPFASTGRHSPDRVFDHSFMLPDSQ